MKEFGYKRAILNILVVLQLIPLSISYFSKDVTNSMISLIAMSILLSLILPPINIFEEVKVVLKTKINIISILLILFNILMLLFLASYYGGRY